MLSSLSREKGCGLGLGGDWTSNDGEEAAGALGCVGVSVLGMSGAECRCVPCGGDVVFAGGCAVSAASRLVRE